MLGQQAPAPLLGLEHRLGAAPPGSTGQALPVLSRRPTECGSGKRKRNTWLQPKMGGGAQKSQGSQ